MRVSYCGALAVFMVLVSSTLAADTSCIKITLPNVLGIGECLGTGGDVCLDDSEAQNGVASVVAQLVTCVLNGAVVLDVGDQLNILQQLLLVIGTRIGLGIPDLNKGLYKFCQSALSSIFNCKALTIQQDIVCSDPIIINLPSALSVGKCSTQLTSTCANGQFISTDDLTSLINTVTCLVKNLQDQDIKTISNGLACSLQNYFRKLFGSLGNAVSGLLQTLLKPILKINC